jgi:hypothetical protein
MVNVILFSMLRFMLLLLLLLLLLCHPHFLIRSSLAGSHNSTVPLPSTSYSLFCRKLPDSTGMY